MHGSDAILVEYSAGALVGGALFFSLVWRTSRRQIEQGRLLTADDSSGKSTEQVATNEKPKLRGTPS